MGLGGPSQRESDSKSRSEMNSGGNVGGDVFCKERRDAVSTLYPVFVRIGIFRGRLSPTPIISQSMSQDCPFAQSSLGLVYLDEPQVFPGCPDLGV